MLIGVLKGVFLFLVDLMWYLDIGCEVDFMVVVFYGLSIEFFGVVCIFKDFDVLFEDCYVLIVEDIVDFGLMF